MSSTPAAKVLRYILLIAGLIALILVASPSVPAQEGVSRNAAEANGTYLLACKGCGYCTEEVMGETGW